MFSALKKCHTNGVNVDSSIQRYRQVVRTETQRWYFDMQPMIGVHWAEKVFRELLRYILEFGEEVLT